MKRPRWSSLPSPPARRVARLLPMSGLKCAQFRTRFAGTAAVADGASGRGTEARKAHKVRGHQTQRGKEGFSFGRPASAAHSSAPFPRGGDRCSAPQRRFKARRPSALVAPRPGKTRRPKKAQWRRARQRTRKSLENRPPDTGADAFPTAFLSWLAKGGGCALLPAAGWAPAGGRKGGRRARRRKRDCGRTSVKWRHGLMAVLGSARSHVLGTAARERGREKGEGRAGSLC